MTTFQIPFVYWGGEPIRIRAQSKSFKQEDITVLRRWGVFLSNPSKASRAYIDYLRYGRTWISVPSYEPGTRLFLRPFCDEPPGSRPLWYFLGCKLSDLTHGRRSFGAIIAGLSALNRSVIDEERDYLTIEASEAEAPLQGTNLHGLVLTGQYISALATLGKAICDAPEQEVQSAVIGSNPPDSHIEFTTLLLSDDFCYRSIILKAKPTSGAESKPEMSAPVAPTRSEKALPFKLLGLIAWTCACIGSFFLGAYRVNGGLRVENARLHRDNNDLLIKNTDDYESILKLSRESAEIQKINENLAREVDRLNAYLILIRVQ